MWIQRFGGYALAIGGLIWVLHDVHPHELLGHLTIHDWRWVAAAVAADILAYLCQGLRWSLLLSPIGRLPALGATEAIYAGLFTNEVLPLHVGELVRTHVAARKLAVRFRDVLPSIAVERLLDGIWLALGIGLVTLMVPLPDDLRKGADIFGFVVFVCVAGFVYLVYRSPGGIGARFRQIAASGRLGQASIFSLMLVVLQALSFWMVMPAFGLRLSWWAGAAVFLIVHMGTAIPNAPANAGSYQFFTVLGLLLFGVDKTTATAFSFVAFFVLTIPLWILGFFAFSRTGLKLGRLRSDVPRMPL